MRVVYGTQFEIRKNGSNNDKLFEEIKITIIDWVRDWYQRKKSVNIDISTSNIEIEPINEHKIKISVQSIKTNVSIFTVIWNYPDETDSNLLWQSQCLVANYKGEIEFSCIIRLSARAFQVRPLEYTLGRPRLIKTIIEKFPCFIGNQKLSIKPTNINAQEVEPFIKNILLSPERDLPIIMVSNENETNRWIVNPNDLADRLAGIGIVYHLIDKWATYSLSDQLTNDYCCFNGAIRIYWPGFTIGDDCFYHQLYAPITLERISQKGEDIYENIFRKLSSISSVRIVEGKITKDVLNAITNEANINRTRLQEKIQNGKITEDKLKKETLDLLNAIKQKDEIIKALGIEIEEQKKNWYEYQKSTKQEVLTEESETECIEKKFKSVNDVLEYAKHHLGKDLIVLDSAMKSAVDSSFPRTDEAYHALEAIYDISMKYFESKEKQQSLGGPLESLFRVRGFTYAPHESDTTRTQFGDQRTFLYKGKRLMFHKHLTLGGGSRDDCIQIYFTFDEDDKKIVIGYCGRHLDYARMRT